MNRRKFLKGTGLVLLGSGLVAGGILLTSRKTPYKTVFSELTTYLKNNNLGRIGKSYEGDGQSIVLGIRQVHKLSTESELKMLDMSEIDESISDFYVSVVNNVAWCQEEIYDITRYLTNKTGEVFALGLEGIADGGELPELKTKKNIENNPELGNKLYFYENTAGIILAQDPNIFKPIGLENKDYYLNPNGINNIDRNYNAVNKTIRAMSDKSLKFGAIIFGSDHFTRIVPTIPQLLEKANQPYIEFIPRSAEKLGRLIENFGK